MFEENNDFIPQEEVEQETPIENKTTFEEYVKYQILPPYFHKRREIRRTALGVGIPSICLSLIGFVWSAIYLFFTVNIAKMSYKEAVELSQNPAVGQILQIIISILMFLVPFSIAAKCMGFRIDRLVKFEKAKKGTFLPFFALGVGFCAFFNIATAYASTFFENIGIDYEVDFGETPRGFFGFLLTFIATAIVPALVEEFACRGIVMGMLKKHGERFAIVTSAIVFGTMHGNFEQIPFAIMVGLVLGYIYIKTGSIWPGVAVHCANNAIAVIFDYLSDILTDNLQSIVYMLYLTAALLAGIIGFYLLAKKGKEEYGIVEKEEIITKKQKYTWFFTSWVIILFFVFNLVESLSYFVI